MAFEWEVFLTSLIWLAVVVIIWATQIERRLYQIRREELAILPAGHAPIRVLQIGDIHLAPWQKGRAQFVRSLASRVQPDLVVNTGDNLGHRDGIDPVLAALEPLLALPGVFVNGSNDYHAPTPRNPFTYLAHPSDVGAGAPLDTARLVGAFEKAGWLNLNNRSARLSVNGTHLAFVGVDDAHEHLDDLTSLDAPTATETIAAGEVVLGVSHAPYLRVIEAMGNHGVELLFAGHTHGGQVCVPFYGALTTNCDLPTKSAKGLSRFEFRGKKIWLNVVAGLGHSIFAPVRFACLPEVRVLTLVAK